MNIAIALACCCLFMHLHFMYLKFMCHNVKRFGKLFTIYIFHVKKNSNMLIYNVCTAFTAYIGYQCTLFYCSPLSQNVWNLNHFITHYLSCTCRHDAHCSFDGSMHMMLMECLRLKFNAKWHSLKMYMQWPGYKMWC